MVLKEAQEDGIQGLSNGPALNMGKYGYHILSGKEMKMDLNIFARARETLVS